MPHLFSSRGGGSHHHHHHNRPSQSSNSNKPQHWARTRQNENADTSQLTISIISPKPPPLPPSRYGGRPSIPRLEGRTIMTLQQDRRSGASHWNWQPTRNERPSRRRSGSRKNSLQRWSPISSRVWLVAVSFLLVAIDCHHQVRAHIAAVQMKTGAAEKKTRLQR